MHAEVVVEGGPRLSPPVFTVGMAVSLEIKDLFAPMLRPNTSTTFRTFRARWRRASTGAKSAGKAVGSGYGSGNRRKAKNPAAQ